MRFKGESTKAFTIRMSIVTLCTLTVLSIFWYISHEAAQDRRALRELQEEYKVLMDKYTFIQAENNNNNNNKGDLLKLTKENKRLRNEIDLCHRSAMEEHQRAEFWYQWQHAKNGPHCARALRLVDAYEKDAAQCPKVNNPDYRYATPSLSWWCDVRQKKIEEDTNKITLEER